MPSSSYLYDVIQRDFVQKGIIKHVGFSTHGSTAFILKCLDTDKFEYANIHHHYFGSYTASGNGPQVKHLTLQTKTCSDSSHSGSDLVLPPYAIPCYLWNISHSHLLRISSYQKVVWLVNHGAPSPCA